MKKAFMLVELVIVIAIIGLIMAMAIPAFRDRGKSERMEYDAWCRFSHRTDVRFDDWVILKRAKLLPGQRTEEMIIQPH